MADAQPLLAGKSCLVLDDEFLIALDIQQFLEAAGAQDVVCVRDAEEAFAVLRQHPRFDLAVLDVRLDDGRYSSLTVAAALAEKGTPFVFLTGMRGEDLHTAQFPDTPVVEKPYNPRDLMDCLLRALAAR